MDEQRKVGFIQNNLPWFLFISASINLGLASYIIYYQRESQIKLGDLISISSGLISIALAVVAIIYSVSESIKNNTKEQELSKIVSKVDKGVSDTQEILSKVNVGTANTHDILDRMSKQFIDLQDTITVIKEQYQQEHTMSEMESSVKFDIDNNSGTDEVVDITNTDHDIIDDKVITNLENNNSIDTNNNSDDNANEELNNNLNYISKNIEEQNYLKERRKNFTCRRGDVFFADLRPVRGSEYGGIQPVVIVQNDIGNRYSPTVVILAITAQIHKTKLPTHVEISEEELPISEGTILTEQIRTIDKLRLKEKIGVLSENTMKRVNKAITVELNLD